MIPGSIPMPMRRCGPPFTTAEEAQRSKAAHSPGAVIEVCWIKSCGAWHVRQPRTRPAAVARVPLKMTGARMPGLPGATGFSRGVKLAVRKRAGNGFAVDALCESCGCRLGEYGGDIQHRVARGMGGCKDEVVNSCAAAALMCRPCHERAEARDPHMGMNEAGFWIEHGAGPEFDPRLVPIMLHGEGGGGLVVWLAVDGHGDDGSGYLRRAPELVAA